MDNTTDPVLELIQAVCTIDNYIACGAGCIWQALNAIEHMYIGKRMWGKYMTSKQQTIQNEQVYQCQDCGAIYNEKDIPSVRIDGYFRLYCNCQSENLKLIK